MLHYKKGVDGLSEGISYQNKDIEFKLLSESFKEKSFEAYGLKLPRIKEVLPTNLPDVSANELRIDNLFLLEDGTYALVDYESEDKTENRIKYVNYIARILKRFYHENKIIPTIRMIVIYTGDVQTANDTFCTGCMVLHMEQVFLQKLPSEEIYQQIHLKLNQNDTLTEQELMQMIILPLAEKGRKEKQKRIRQIIELAKQMQNEQEQKFVFSGLLVVSDKFITKEDAEIIRREFSMTKVGMLLMEEGMEKGMEKERITAILNMLKLHIPEQKILEMYSPDDLKTAKEYRTNF